MTHNVEDSVESPSKQKARPRAKISDNVEERGSKLIEQRSELDVRLQIQDPKRLGHLVANNHGQTMRPLAN